MKFFLDTADIGEIRWAAQAGLIDGVTTNPTLLSKSAGDLDPNDVLTEICSLVHGPVSFSKQSFICRTSMTQKPR